MANYCTTAQVVTELPHITISESTKPTTTEVTGFCTDISADMDARMHAVGITTPVTDTEGLAVLKTIALNGVKAMVLRAKQAEDGDGEAAAVYQQLYNDAMYRIEIRPAIIRDTDTPGRPQGTARTDSDIAFTRTGTEW